MSSGALRRVRVFLLDEGQGEGESCTAIRIRCHPDLSAVTLDHRARHQQSQPHALDLGRDEWLKQPFGDFGVDAGAAV